MHVAAIKVQDSRNMYISRQVVDGADFEAQVTAQLVSKK